MRFVEEKLGAVRIKSWFAVFPVTIGNETRWLERVTTKQEYKEMANLCGDVVVPENTWVNIKFL